jgi:hypothetical protein
MRPGVGFEPLGPVFVRGIAEPVPIVRVLTAIDVDWPPESSERADHAPT